MSATIIDGRAMAARIREEVREEAARLKASRGVVPSLAFILVGHDPGSESYVRSKGRACEEMGFRSVTEQREDTLPEEELLRLIRRFNDDPAVHGILVQLPLPKHIRELRVIEAIDPRKDVDGFHPVNAGRLVLGRHGFRPCTPAGVQEMLVRSGNDPGGKHVVVVGRSNIVGKPVANMLVQKGPGANAVVTMVHTGAHDIARWTRQADILIVAAGRPGCITGTMVKPQCVVIDVGINRVEDASSPKGYRLTGDVDFPSVAEVASAISPVPGGVGLMTVAMLMKNTLQAAEELTAEN
jgi:methylenetetrahydrofolate dehydrogenase (NADP+) / methenyltetrahydrofolate cyclohydrolase